MATTHVQRIGWVSTAEPYRGSVDKAVEVLHRSKRRSVAGPAAWRARPGVVVSDERRGHLGAVTRIAMESEDTSVGYPASLHLRSAARSRLGTFVAVVREDIA